MNELYTELDRRQARIEELEKALGDLLDVVNWLQESGNMKSPIVPHPFGLGVLGAKAAARAALKGQEART